MKTCGMTRSCYSATKQFELHPLCWVLYPGGEGNTSEAPIWIEKGGTARYNVPARGIGQRRSELPVSALQHLSLEIPV